MISDISAQEPKSNGVDRLAKLSRMLRSMSRRWPQTSLVRTWEGFGVRLADGRYLHIVRSGNWTAEDIRDLLALFATWCAVDPDYILHDGDSLAGVSAEVTERSK